MYKYLNKKKYYFFFKALFFAIPTDAGLNNLSFIVYPDWRTLVISPSGFFDSSSSNTAWWKFGSNCFPNTSIFLISNFSSVEIKSLKVNLIPSIIGFNFSLFLTSTVEMFFSVLSKLSTTRIISLAKSLIAYLKTSSFSLSNLFLKLSISARSLKLSSFSFFISFSKFFKLFFLELVFSSISLFLSKLFIFVFFFLDWSIILFF